MCKFGDIIVVNQYVGEDGDTINRHSFVVINDEIGKIEGLHYDLVANVMSSFKSEEHRAKKLRFKENLEIKSEDFECEHSNGKNGYIKADQLYYFNKDNLNYYRLGRVDDELLDELVQLVIELTVEGKSKNVIDNIQEEAEVC